MDVGQISNTMLKVLERYSKKNSCKKEETQCIMYFKPEGMIGFKICKGYTPISDESTGDILGLPKSVFGGHIDVFKTRQVVESHIACSLILIGKRLETEPVKLHAMVCHNGKEGKNEGVRIAIYKGKDFLEETALKDMFSDDNIMKVYQMQQCDKQLQA